MIVGLTGGIGSGKSTVASMFAARGAVVIDTDAIAREVVARSSPLLQRLRREFGAGILDPQGGLDRGRLAEIVFADAEKRQRLNEITHPAILERVLNETRRYRDPAIVVVVAPLLFEARLDVRCDLSIAVAAPMQERMRRVMARDEISRDAVQARIDSQLSETDLGHKADIVVRNDADLPALEAEVGRAWEALLAKSGAV